MFVTSIPQSASPRCGFIGSKFVRHVVRERPGVHVAVLHKLTYDVALQNIADPPADRVELVMGDGRDSALVARLVFGAVAVVHYAIDASKLRSELGWEPVHTDFVAASPVHCSSTFNVQTCGARDVCFCWVISSLGTSYISATAGPHS